MTRTHPNQYLDRVFSKNNYNEDFIQRNTYRPTTTSESNDNATHSYDHKNYTMHKGHILEHIAHPKTIRNPRRSQTYHHTTSATD